MYKVKSFGTNHNLNWQLNDKSGYAFEDKIYKAILKELEFDILNKDVSVSQTTRSKDGGKDVIIKTRKNIELFGISYKCYEKSEINIYLECKSTKNELRFEKIIGNAVKSKYQEIDYFTLVTNSTINPNAYYLVENELKPYNIEFVLVDQYLLAKHLNKKHIGLFELAPEYKSTNEKDSFYLEYQISPYSTNEYDGFEIVFLFRNYGKDNYHCRFSLMTNVNWNMEERALDFIISSNLATSKKIHLKNDNSDNYNSLIFKIESNINNATLKIENINLKESFEPPFIGEDRKRICDTIVSDIKNPNGNNLICFWGEAGIGKTRIVKEIIKKLQGSLFDICEIHLNKNNEKSIYKICDFLAKKSYIQKSNYETCDFYKIVASSNDYIKTALIFIDDFHYATKELIEQIKEINNSSNKAVRFIICGRTDYSYGNFDYYSFVEWTKVNLTNEECVCLISPLKDDEIKNLILVMIDNIPKNALDLLVKKSNNNPLFVVQYIEYLLGENLAYIVNRNSVGIIDPSTFSTKTSIPSKISDIYSLRLNNLITQENGEILLKLLLAISIYDGELHRDVLLKYFDDFTLIERLTELRFIVFKNNYYRFVHESLLVFVNEIAKSKHSSIISKYLLSINGIENTLSKYQLGRLFLWNRNIKEAEFQFTEISSVIAKNENISNLNINMEMYDYLYDVYNLYKNNTKFEFLLEKILKTRIYITLHHLMPYNAVIECDRCIELINENKIITNKELLINTILAQKAHALLNSGKNHDGYLILNEIQSRFLMNSKSIENEALFDVYDRLLAVYIKFNMFCIAKNYADLEMSVAKEHNNYALQIIAHRTHSKLYYFQDYEKCKHHINEVYRILKYNPTIRIELNNKVYEYIVDMTYDKIPNYNVAKTDLENILYKAKSNSLNRTEIQAEMVLAALLIKYGSNNDLKHALNHIKTAISNSVSYGINSYLWQLYNLKAIVLTKLEKNADVCLKLFNTVLEILINQNLNCIGSRDLCYSNILALSNVFIFFSQNIPENHFYHEISKIKISSKIANDGFMYNDKRLDLNEKHTQYERARNKKLLFVNDVQKNILKDNKTGFFIALT